MSCVWKHYKSKFWFARFTDAKGKRVNRSTRETNRGKAKIIAEAWERAARGARNGALTRMKAKEVLDQILADIRCDPIPSATIKEILDGWIDDVDNVGTQNRYKVVAGKFLEHLRDRASIPGNEINTADVQAFITKRGKERAAKTASNDLRCLSAAFSRAMRLGLVDRNPCLAVKPPEGSSVTRKPFSAEQVAMLIKAAPSDEWRTLIRIMWFTALRLGDASTLQWSEVDLANGSMIRKQEKTGDDVSIPLHPELIEDLESIAGDIGGAILPTLSTLKPGGKRGLSEQFGDIVLAAGIDPERVKTRGGRALARLSAHSMRHGATTAMANAGADADKRMLITGHSDTESHKRYTHHGVESLRATVGKIPSLKPKLE